MRPLATIREEKKKNKAKLVEINAKIRELEKEETEAENFEIAELVKKSGIKMEELKKILKNEIEHKNETEIEIKKESDLIEKNI